MPKFALIAEGPSDVAVIDIVLGKVFGDEYQLSPLSPILDASDKKIGHSNWLTVIDYLKANSDLVDALKFNDYIIVQIDADICENDPMRISKQEFNDAESENKNKTAAKLIEDINKFLKSQINNEEIHNKLIFCTNHFSIECWLLWNKYAQENGSTTIACFNMNCHDRYNRIFSKLDKEKEAHSNYDSEFRSFYKLKLNKLPEKVNKNIPYCLDKFMNELKEMKTMW